MFWIGILALKKAAGLSPPLFRAASSRFSRAWPEDGRRLAALLILH
jgi:hypothetical protein